MAKSMDRQLKKLERDMTKKLNKVIKNTNKKLNPIVLPTKVENISEPISISHYYSDNSINVTAGGDIFNSQIGGEGNKLSLENSSSDILSIMDNIKDYSTILDDSDREELLTILSEVLDIGQIKKESHQGFLKKFPILNLGFTTIVAWGIDNGLEIMKQLIMEVFN